MKKITLLLSCLIALFAANAATTLIDSGGNIQVAIDAATDGDTLVLANGGEYTGGITINKSIVLKSENAEILPKLTTSGLGLAAGNMGYTFEIAGIEVIGSGQHFITMSQGGDSAVYLKLTNLVVHEFSRTILRMDKGTSHVDSVFIENCHFYNFDGDGWNGFYWRDDRVITRYLGITNTTLDGFNEGVLRFDGTFEKKVYIDHCTFNNRSTKGGGTIDGNPLFDVNGPAGSIFKMTNTIIADIDSISVPAFGIDAAISDTIMDCRFFFDEGAVDTTHTWDFKSGFIKGDPMFKDAANNDLSLPKNSPFLTAAPDGGAIGDPRWLPKAKDMLFAYYAFENNLADSSGNGYDGTKFGNPDFVDGRAGKALNFNGAGSGDAVATGIEFAPEGSFTMALWFKVNEWDSRWGNVLIGDRGDNNADGNNYGFQVRQYHENTADESGWFCFTSRGVETDKDFDPRNGDTSTVIKYRSDMPYMQPVYPDGKWNHLVLVYDEGAGKKQIYLNNSLVVDGNILTSTEYPGYIPAAPYDKIFIGARNDADKTTDNPEESFNGIIDEVRIYTAALSEMDIDELYASYGALIPTIAHWKLDETSGTVTADVNGNSTGTMVNMGDTLSVEGFDGNAFDFGKAADSAYIQVVDNDIVDFDSTESFSISALINVNNMNQNSDINVVFKGATGVNEDGGEGKWYTLAIKQNELRFAVDDNITKTQLGVDVSAYYELNKWVHVVAVRDLGIDSLILYYNGSEIGRMADATDNDISSVLPLIIGNNQNHDHPFDGKIDDVKMFDMALGADQVKGLTAEYGIPLFTISDDATLADLRVDGTTIDGFDAATLTYDYELAMGTTTVPVVTVTTSDENASPGTVNATSLPGPTTITVTAQSGSTMVYTVNFTVAAQSGDADLTGISLDPATDLSPAFDKDVTSYTAELPEGTTSVTVSVTKSDANSTVSGDGTIDVTSGSGTANITVTAQDGTTTKTYIINFTVTVGINYISNSGFTAYYNRFNNELVIKGAEKVSEIEIYDMNGRKMSEVTSNITRSLSLDDMALVDNSMYLIRLINTDTNGQFMLKIVK